MKQIQLTKELEDFHTHLQLNPRTILSSVFGNGKSTLLKQYMNKYSYESEFIVLHPVNYSCGSNEDIFEYIKRDILMQLAKKELLAEVDLNAINSSIFTWDNLNDLIGFFLSLAPGGEHINNLWKKFQPWIEKGLDTKDEYKQKALTFDNYNSYFKKQRGGIYEHDAYTTLIEKTISTIHDREQKYETILIIEDMDRVDPAHLFRILNVLGAHLDIDEENENKFGFKNIILVMDYDATKHIFYHFYGEKANYDGYMNKFISHNFYDFDISLAARKELINFLIEKCAIEESIIKAIPLYVENGTTYCLGNIIDQLSVRDVVHIIDNIYEQIIAEDFICNDYLIKSVAPISILFAVLVRLNRRINYNGVFDFIMNSSVGLNLLQQYLVSNNMCIYGTPFKMDNGICYTVTLQQNEGAIVSSMNIQKYYGQVGDGQNNYSMFKKCFDLAKSRVLDCR